MHLTPVASAFDTIYIDIITPLHVSKQGNKHIITLIDGFTRYGEAKAYTQVLVETVIDFIMKRVVLRHGPINKLIYDNGSVFTSGLFKSAMNKLGINICHTTPYHLQANGRFERWNGTLKAIIKKYSDQTQDDWDVYLDRAINIYNNYTHESTKYTPHGLLYGRALRSVFARENRKQIVFSDPHPERLLAREKAARNMREAAKVSKYYYDRKHDISKLNGGDEIMIKNRSRLIGLSRKLAHQWVGPYLLKSFIGPKDNPKVVIFVDGKGELHRAAL